MVRTLVLVVGLTAIAAAQPSPQSTKLFEEGRALAKEGKWSEACDKFAKSLELERAPGTLLNYGDCHEHLGHLALAWRLYDEASTKDSNAERSRFARQRADAVLLKVGTIVVKMATPSAPGLSLTIAGRITQPAAEVRELVDPGEVVVEVSAPNMQPVRKTERIDGGKTIVIDVPALQPVVRVETQTTTERRHSRVIAAYALGGIGGVSLITGVVLGVVARAQYQSAFSSGDCMEGSPPMCNIDGFNSQNNAITVAQVGTVFGIGGLVLIGAGAVVFLTAPRDVVVVPTATTQSAGLAVVGRF